MGNQRPANSRSAHWKFLHLEDSKSDAEMITELLAESGLKFAITLAATRKEFEAALGREGFDLILCDYNVPGYSGRAALATALKIQPDVPVIIISGTLGEIEAVECLQLGACDYLIKERLQRLGAAAQRALEEAKTHKAQQAAEEALRVSEQRFRQLVEKSLDLICETSLEGVFLYTSPNFQPTLGYSADDLAGKSLLDFVHPSERATVEQGFRQEELHVDFRFRHRDDSYRWIEMSGQHVEMAGGHVRFGLIGRDVTERRSLEEQLRQAQKLESIGQLAGGVAHDFNNILTIICGYSSLLLEEPELPMRFRGSIGEVLDTANRATNLTRQLLAFSRKQVMQRKSLDLNPVVAEMSQMLKRMLGSEIELRFEAGKNLPPIYADPGMLEQVLLNLAVNARDAMPHGGKLTVSTARSATNPSREKMPFSQEFGVGVELRVTDTGCGIPPEVMPRIFEAFFTTKEVNKGTGLGLATVQSIVREHHGTIKVESTSGVGTAFIIVFPATKAEISAVAVNPDAPMSSGKGSGTVMVVDDEPAVRELMETILRSGGYDLLSAGSGRQALTLFEQREKPIHLLLTDISMPEGVTGEQLANFGRETNPHLRVIFSSGHGLDVLSETARSSSDFQFLPKPFRAAELLSAVSRSLSAMEQPA